MDILIVGIIVALALAFIIRGLVRIFQGKNSCSCGSNCSSEPGSSCFQGQGPFIKK